MTDSDFDTWVICRHRFAETSKSAVITVNTTFEQRFTFAEFPHHVAITVDAAAQAQDAAGRIGAHESQHLLALTRVIREALDSLELHLIAIVHGAGARTLEMRARDGDAAAVRLHALNAEKTWDRPWRFEIAQDPSGQRAAPWRAIAQAAEEHHLAVNVPHSPSGLDHHHFLF